jgi:hypothetical protein
MKTKLVHFAFLALACVPAAIAQDKRTYVQHVCVKAAPGQIAGLSAMVPDISKFAQVQVDEGRLAFLAVLRAIIPAGNAARCDYIFASGYEGYPPEPFTRAEAEANFRKSGVAGTYDDYLARQRQLWTLVSNDLARVPNNGTVGSGASVGSYIRLNLDKLKPGHTVTEWAKFERDGWGAYVEAVAKDHPGFAWREEALVSPAGSAMNYNVMSVDILPNWAVTGGGWGGAEVWNKVHPDMTDAAFMAKLSDMIDRSRVELYRTAALVVKK